MIRRCAVCLLALAALPAAAQDVTRCQGPDGKVSYVGGPCPPGTTAVRALPPADAPSAADQQAARERAQKDARSAAALESKRQAAETRAAREQEQRLAKAKKQEAHCRRLETRLRQAQEDLAAAPLKRRAEAQRRVKRAEELHAEDCPPAVR